MNTKERYLMCHPDYYEVSYVINPWMAGNIGRTEVEKACGEWEKLYKILAETAEVEVVDQSPGMPDMVFTANAGLVLENEVLLSRFAHYQRRPEESHFETWFKENGFKVHTLPQDIFFEGAGDALFEPGGQWLWAAYGQRSSLASHPYLAKTFEVKVLSLRLVDQRYYHLDTCFCPLPGGYLMYYPDAFDKRSTGIIEEHVPPGKRIILGASDTQLFAANALCSGNTIIVNRCSRALKIALEKCGFKTVETGLNEFIKAGGSAKCLTLRLNEMPPSRREVNSGVVGRKITTEGQLIDSQILSRMCNAVVDGGGSVRVSEIRLGQKQQDSSFAELEIIAPDHAVLDEIVQVAIRLGGRYPGGAAAEARLEAVEKDGSVPDTFYATTIYPTEVRVRNRWVPVENQRMDAVIVVSGGRARCELMRNVKAGDMVVTGGDGIMITGNQVESGRAPQFGFMTSNASSERPIETAVEKITWEMRRIKNRNGKIIVVAGPVTVHTRGSRHLAWMARNGYVNAFLGGNGVAVHDMEQSLFGTSLGFDLATGLVREGGHRNHLATINIVRRAGGIKAAVENGLVKSGLFYELVKNGIPFCLAGSIRDDGPLPDTEMDLMRAQDEYARLIQGADMILVLASMLHAIGTGNMTPAGVKLICVDINPAVVTKLSDRGSLESVGIVADAGLFLADLVKNLEKFDDPVSHP